MYLFWLFHFNLLRDALSITIAIYYTYSFIFMIQPNTFKALLLLPKYPANHI